MFRSIVVDVVALAESREVLRGVVGRVGIAVPGGEDHTGRSYSFEHVVCSDREADEAPGSITPSDSFIVPPATIPEMEDALSTRTGTNLAASLRPLEADDG